MRRSRTFRRRKPRKPALPYESRQALLSRGEAAFFFALRRAVAGRYLIALKVRLADLITCPETAWKAGFGYMIARHHVDFVLCDHRTTIIRLAIELDDRSHDRQRRKDRDAFINQALAAGGISLLRIQAAARYDAGALGDAISTAIKWTSKAPSA